MQVFWIALLLGLVQASLDSPLIPGEQPQRQASVGAGEGPAWDGKAYLYFTGEGHISRRDSSGRVSMFREVKANGLLFDHQGRLVVCEQGERRVTRIEPSGEITVLADRFEGMKFNSPNDLAIDSKGRVYFSDPRYGSRAGMEMIEGVYRIDAPGKVKRIISNEVERPNGLLVSPGDKFLYVADNRNDAADGARKLWRFGLRADGSIDSASRKLIFDWGTARGPDGLDIDEAGRLYVAAGRSTPTRFEAADKFKGGIYILSAEGKLIEFVHVSDDEVTNCAFGGPDRRTLFITAGGHLWSLQVRTAGWALRAQERSLR